MSRAAPFCHGGPRSDAVHKCQSLVVCHWWPAALQFSFVLRLSLAVSHRQPNLNFDLWFCVWPKKNHICCVLDDAHCCTLLCFTFIAFSMFDHFQLDCVYSRHNGGVKVLSVSWSSGPESVKSDEGDVRSDAGTMGSALFWSIHFVFVNGICTFCVQNLQHRRCKKISTSYWLHEVDAICKFWSVRPMKGYTKLLRFVSFEVYDSWRTTQKNVTYRCSGAAICIVACDECVVLCFCLEFRFVYVRANQQGFLCDKFSFHCRVTFCTDAFLSCSNRHS